MENNDAIKTYLDSCTNGPASGCAKGTGLLAVHKMVYDHKSNIPKAKLVDNLIGFYADQNNIVAVWNELSQCEKDFVGMIVQYDGNEYLPTILELAKANNIPLEKEIRPGFKRSILDDYRYSRYIFLHLLINHIPQTRAVIFFPSGKDLPPFVLKTLKTVVEPMKYEYAEYTPVHTDFIISREHRLSDFAALVRFSGAEQLRVKPWTLDITKAKLAKFVQTAGFDEVCDLDGRFATPKEVRRNADFRVAPKIFGLSTAAGLVDVAFKSTGTVAPGANSVELLTLPQHILAQRLFQSYSESREIIEIHYVTYITTYDGDAWVDWPKCRKPVIELLKSCPVGSFVSFEDFNKYAKIFCGNFFRKLLNCAVMVKGYDFGYRNYGSYEPDWDECEARLIRVILAFLGAIGMVDIAYCESVPRINYADDDFCVGIAGFRVNALGAYVLGVTDKYDAPSSSTEHNNEGDIVVLPDYSVVITGLKPRIAHETYLSKFLTKVTLDENAAIYKLDFASMVRALDIGITPQKVKDYLKKATEKPFADNVTRSLDDWQAKVGRVKIRTIPIIETDDLVLLEEIKHIRGMGKFILDDIHNATQIIGTSEKQVKVLIEKNGWLVKME
jgi:hypothetical protein